MLPLTSCFIFMVPITSIFPTQINTSLAKNRTRLSKWRTPAASAYSLSHPLGFLFLVVVILLLLTCLTSHIDFLPCSVFRYSPAVSIYHEQGSKINIYCKAFLRNSLTAIRTGWSFFKL